MGCVSHHFDGLNGCELDNLRPDVNLNLNGKYVKCGWTSIIMCSVIFAL